MLSGNLFIFIEYKVNQSYVKEYEKVMKKIINKLPEFGADKIQWFLATDQPNLYVEMFQVPTEAHFHALKKFRRSKDHHLFGQLSPMIEGGLSKLNCWAFKACHQD